MNRQPMIAVCGAADCDATVAARAYDVGHHIAEAHAILVCGGLGGVMEAACHGASDAGGLTIGILPGTDPAAANPFVQIVLPTGMGQARNLLIVLAAHVVIAIHGGYGTLSEIALARKCGRTVIGLGSWDLGHDADGRPHILTASSPSHALQLAQHAIAHHSSHAWHQ